MLTATSTNTPLTYAGGWQQRSNLRVNVRVLTQFRAYRPIFAIPFRHSHKWTGETTRIARDERVDIVLADGGINLATETLYRRIPSDG